MHNKTQGGKKKRAKSGALFGWSIDRPLDRAVLPLHRSKTFEKKKKKIKEALLTLRNLTSLPNVTTNHQVKYLS